MEQKIKVYIEYEQEILPLGEVTDFQQLCQQIEDNLDGVKVQDLNITFKTPSGMVVNVKNDSTFHTAREEMNPELKFICTLKSLPGTMAPIAPQIQDVLKQGIDTEAPSKVPPLTSKPIKQKICQEVSKKVDSLQQYFPMNAKKQTLEDFNCLHKYQAPVNRKKHIEMLKSEPAEFNSFIIKTLFGFILRKDEMSLIKIELEQMLPAISLKFLLSYLLQSADFGLRVRLNNYLCQYKAVPLIMNCQQTFKDSKLMNYNQELIFSISDQEGVGVFAFGIGANGTNPCGKSEISNLIVTPKFDNKSFDVQDLNVFSNGQIDVFLEKCQQEKSGWAFMDGQGEISEQSLLSVLPLTNIVLIHFFQKDQNDQTSVAELAQTINLIKDNDSTIQVCLILRDCPETKEVLKNEYPVWLPNREKIDKLIELINVSNETRLVEKSNLIEKLMLYFNESVRKIQSLKNIKFTKENFRHDFCRMHHKGKETFKRISDILKLSENFVQKVQVLKENFFSDQGLPSFKIKDQIREVNLKYRNFDLLPGEDQKSSIKREQELRNQCDKLTDELSKLKVNPLMEQFWQILNHEDTVQMKLEVSNSLQKLTLENIQDIVFQKEQLKNNFDKADYDSNEQRQKAQDEYEQKMKEIDDQILQRSLSYEVLWKTLTCLMTDSELCNYWTDDLNRQKINKAAKQQILHGDTLQFIDGRNLEIKANIIREILGHEIQNSKCIVVSVIGPYSTGKSTLMNLCFGTQFSTSYGRCSQGINFALKKIPPEMQNGKDVDYLIILESEGMINPSQE